MLCEQNTNFNLYSDDSFVRREHPLLLMPNLYIWQYGFLTEEFVIFFKKLQIFIKYETSGGFGKMRRDPLRGNLVKLKM